MNKSQKAIQDKEEYNRIKKTIDNLKESNKELEFFRKRNELDFSLLEINYKRQQKKLIQEKSSLSEEMHKNNIEIHHLIIKMQDISKKYNLEDN